MQRQPVITKDGSLTISIPEMNVTYHSLHGALQESMHVYIEAGFKFVAAGCKQEDGLSVFEMGFGTGLNALLTLIEAERLQLPVYYAALELFPLQTLEISSLNYCELLNRKELQLAFEKMHECEWEKDIAITTSFTLHKKKQSLYDLKTAKPANLVYFDAFAPTAQPKLWTREIFEKITGIMRPGGILVTYCSKSIVRKAMQAAGLIVEKIQGPLGKREMVRAERR